MTMRHGGYMLVDKRGDMSSHTAVQIVRRTLGIGGRRGVKAGHAGTLDPFASGLLVVLIGRATRLMPYVVGHDKRYLLQIALGSRTDSDDRTGVVISDPADTTSPDDITNEQITVALREIAARTTQIPPNVSAIHIDGERAYRRVRAGETIEIPERPVRIDAIDVVGIDRSAAVPIVTVDVRCASGTYMRSIARDLGDLLECGAHAHELRRTEVGEWALDAPDEGGACTPAPAPDRVTGSDLRPALELIPTFTRVELTADQVEKISHGRAAHVDADPTHTDVAGIAPDGSLACIGTIHANGMLAPDSVFIDPPAETPSQSDAEAPS